MVEALNTVYRVENVDNSFTLCQGHPKANVDSGWTKGSTTLNKYNADHTSIDDFQ